MTSLREAQSYTVQVDRPADFDEFWARTLEQLSFVPLRPSFEYVPEKSTAEVAVYDVHYDSWAGVRIAGWYAVPRQEYLAAPYPALMLLPGYVSEPVIPKAWARKGYAAFAVAPRGKLRSNALFNPGYPGLLTENIVDPATYAYRGFYLDAVRAVDAVLTRPEVDADRVGLHGSSQGGALTITTAGLMPDVITCGAAGAPYLCGFVDSAQLTRSYPYEEINEFLSAHPEHEQAVAETLSYYDGINFAPDIRASMMVYAGLEDDVCPPETGIAVYDAMNCPKELHTYERCGHDAGHHWVVPKVEAFLAERLRPAAPETGSGRVTQKAVSVKPNDFAAYWDEVDTELAETPARPILEHIPARSTADYTAYEVRLTSIDGYRIFGFLSIPTGEGPFPGLLITPPHCSVINQPHYVDRLRYVTMTVAHRGQRLADSPYAASYPGLLAERIDDPRAYVYRGIVADCIRAAEFLTGLPELDPAQVAIAGNDLALIVAALRPVFDAVQVNDVFLYQANEARLGGDYPLEEINDFLRGNPQAEESVARTLGYFDAGRHAAGIATDVWMASTPDEPGRMEALADEVGPRAFRCPLSHEGQTDLNAADKWLADRFGVRAI